MNTIIRSSEFDGWLSALADHKAKARVLARIAAAKLGNFGDSEPVGEGFRDAYPRWRGLSRLFHAYGHGGLFSADRRR